MIPKLGKVQRIAVREAWPNEASSFTPWLASVDGLELLQEALDMDLEVEATEQSVGAFKADILAKRTDTTDDHWVLIENQLEKTDHRHLGQLLTYAAGLDAATIVWVAERFEEEHRAALDWLNEITGDRFEFFGLEIELWQIAGSPPAPMFNIIVQPNDWSRDVKQSAENSLTEMQKLQQSYWQGLRGELIERGGPVRPNKAPAQSWMTFGIGRSGTWLGACVNSLKDRVWVEFCMNGPPGKLWFDHLAAQKGQIEAQIGSQLEWQRLDSRKMSKILLPLEPANPTDRDDWSRQHRWMAEKLALFHRTFTPLVHSLPSEAETQI